MSDSISKARTLRGNPTPAEKKLWEKLRHDQLGVRFRRQAPIGRYFADFACRELKLIVEVDGETHAEPKSDLVLTKYLTDLGFEVVRFWNNDVMENIEGVMSRLTDIVTAQKNKQA